MKTNNEVKAGDDYREKLVSINRTAKTVSGGRNFSFTALVVVGMVRGEGSERQILLGLGVGKATDVPEAIRKAMEQGRKNMKPINLDGNTIHYEVMAKFGATKVLIKPAAEGTGIIASHAMRAVFEVIGVENILAKIFGSANPINVVRATFKALYECESPDIIALKRGKTLEQIRPKKVKKDEEAQINAH